ncbi:hypothetical protein [Domibacillus robiginosus]|uniref:hypothetical protein n=1 Tax=Domibacillus robiginosus TaxID=1071054 RepID=UPI00067B758E|nr:hypothetical protein [Domibacillus robiginosus]
MDLSDYPPCYCPFQKRRICRATAAILNACGKPADEMKFYYRQEFYKNEINKGFLPLTQKLYMLFEKKRWAPFRSVKQ